MIVAVLGDLTFPGDYEELRQKSKITEGAVSEPNGFRKMGI